MVGKAYTQILGFKPGDSFEIKLSKKQIRLIQIDNESNELISNEDNTIETIDISDYEVEEDSSEEESLEEATETFEYSDETEASWNTESDLTADEDSATDETAWTEEQEDSIPEENNMVEPYEIKAQPVAVY
jgi:hypothetical protein